MVNEIRVVDALCLFIDYAAEEILMSCANSVVTSGRENDSWVRLVGSGTYV